MKWKIASVYNEVPKPPSSQSHSNYYKRSVERDKRSAVFNTKDNGSSPTSDQLSNYSPCEQGEATATAGEKICD